MGRYYRWSAQEQCDVFENGTERERLESAPKLCNKVSSMADEFITRRLAESYERQCPAYAQHYGYELPMSAKSPNSFWIPQSGLREDIIQADIQFYLGGDALVKAGDCYDTNEVKSAYPQVGNRTLLSQRVFLAIVYVLIVSLLRFATYIHELANFADSFVEHNSGSLSPGGSGVILRKCPQLHRDSINPANANCCCQLHDRD